MKDLNVPLSKAQRLLLMTDGSVTTLLEVLTGKPVVVKTLLQQVVRADTERAAALDVEEGDNINYRVVVLKNDDDRPLIYAESYTPIARAQKEFRHDLMKADIPIGRILTQRRIESRREIRRVDTTSNDELSDLFGVPHNVLLLSRTYDIISHGMVLMRITETFPSTSFVKNAVEGP
ncbi:MAG TPA: chorismate lyase [Candidatus Bathyarchaeia archaeon]|nr:chorismate lyase [Candidatus Bathyarchaeia archaeon]